MLIRLPILPSPWSSPLDGHLSRRKRSRLRRLLWSDRPRCFYCDRFMTEHGATLDHLVPVARGGSQRADNLVLCCRDCNAAKGTLTPAEWLVRLQLACASLAPHQLHPLESETAP